MLFSSIIFLFWFLPLFLLAYFGTPRRFRNYTALAGSYLFYAWGAPRFVFVLIAMSICDYALSILLEKTTNRPYVRKTLITLGILGCIAPLFYFKYSNYFVHEFQNLFHVSSFVWQNVILPIGISFITFHRISYLVDVYRGTTHAAQRFTDYALYLALFPHSIAGPIIRYHGIAQELRERFTTLDTLYEGLYRFCIGLGKKVLIANTLGETAQAVFQLDPASLTAPYAWLGIICYAFQIFFDFSGYSDMAIGLAKMMGFTFPENFNNPYIAQSFTDFWRRWHISLSGWMREYLYIPLGGNRISKFRTYFNLWIVFAISGFWHGANATFLVWGIYQGLFIVLDKLFWLRLSHTIPRVVQITSTFFLILLGWVFFRSDSLHTALIYFGHLFGVLATPTVYATWMDLITYRGIFVLIVAGLISFAPAFFTYKTATQSPLQIFRKNVFATCLLLFSLASLVSAQFNPFIYFRF